MFYKVLIVDDEPFMREELLGLVSWADHGFEVVGAASNGEDAYAAVQADPVDLLITDIKMPRMDGLALIERVRRRWPGTIPVVMSAYDEFHLVKDSFKLGVVDYLLKSEIDSDEVAALLARIRRKLDGLGTGNSNPVSPVVSDPGDVWNRFVLAPDLSHRSGESELAESFERVCVLHLDFETSDELVARLSDETRLFMSDHRGPGFLLHPGEGGYTVILGCDPASRTPSDRPTLQVDDLFDRLANIVMEQRGERVAGGLSTTGITRHGYARLIAEAREAAANAYFRGRQQLIRFRSLYSGKRPAFLEQDRAARLRRLLDTQDMRGLAAAAPDLCVPEKIYEPASVGSVRALFQRYYYALVEFVSTSPFAMGAEIGRRIEAFGAALSGAGLLKDHNRLFRAVLEELTRRGTGTGRLVRHAVGYIHEHYSKDLSLADLACRLGVSTPYLSRTFSKEMGVNFVGYVSQVRMQEAAKLLASSDLKIYEIAERVGYPNAEHFSRTFKKVMGTSPTQYLTT